jgi:hypothetical protein
MPSWAFGTDPSKSAVRDHLTAGLRPETLERLATDLYVAKEVKQVGGGTRTFPSFPRLDQLLSQCNTPEGAAELAAFFRVYSPDDSSALSLVGLLVEDMRMLKARREELRAFGAREAALEDAVYEAERRTGRKMGLKGVM